ncbi:MAG: hypothetical protein R3C18_18665 [Planctomycetaceae bacterium]
MHEKLSVECLDDSFRHGVECLACHAPIASDMGVYFGRSIPQHTLGYDLTGWDHFGRSRILIASPDIAESLESSFGVDAAYGVFPIFDANGPTAQSIRDVLHRLTPYKGMHPLWKQQS